MKFSITNILVGILVIVVVGGGYYYFFSGSGTETPLSASAPQSQVEQQFIGLVSQLGTVSFNTSIFSDPRFTALVNIATPIAPEPSGRPDPFAPVGVGSPHAGP